MEDFKIYDCVERIDSSHAKRRGIVIGVEKYPLAGSFNVRCRVVWLRGSNGLPMDMIKTWVSISSLKKVDKV